MQEINKMAFDKAKAYLDGLGFGDRVMVFDVSSATVDLAAVAVGTEPEKIAKSLTFMVDNKAVMVVCAGTAKVNNGKFKAQFHTKAKMLTYDEVHEMIGHDVGGVCPFGVGEDVQVYLDISLKRYDTVYPACGSDNSAVRLTPDEFEQIVKPLAWVDVCKMPGEE